MLLKTRINIVAVTATIVVAVALIIISALVLNESDDRFKSATIGGKTVLWQKIVSSQLDQMEAASRSLSRDSDTLEALKDSNIEALSENAITTFNLLSTSDVLSRLQLTNINGRILFSEPLKATGDTKKILVKKSISEGTVQRGVELGDDGKMVAVVSFPLYFRGKMIGAGVYVRDLQPALIDLKLNSNAESFIINDKGNAEYTTSTGMFQKINTSMKTMVENSQSYVQVDKKSYSVVVLPIKDPKEAIMGYLVSADDQTESYLKQNNMINLSYVVGITAIIISVIILSLYLKLSFKPLDSVLEIMAEIAKGDLSSKIKSQVKQDEIGTLLTALQDMNNKLRVIVSDVRDSADQTASVTKELAKGNTDLSKRTEEQAASLEETASHMEEMTVTVRQNADNAHHADRLAANAKAKSVSGIEVINGATMAMDEISGTSKRVTEIITVIEDIAFQTNLLALNATVEAAHAGRHGLGFKVVADEVRALSARSSVAAKEIKNLIQEMQDVVKTGEGKVNESKTMLLDIDSSIEEVATHVNEIAAASEEQSQGLNQVNEAITHMDNMTQQNAALVEEASAASHSLEDQASWLNEIVGLFKLSKSDVRAVNVEKPKQQQASSDDVLDFEKARVKQKREPDNAGSWVEMS